MIRDSRLLAAPLALLVVAAPLPFASVTPGFAAALGVALLLLAAASLLSAPRAGTPKHVAGVAAAIAAIAALGLLQSIAWPVAVTEALSPLAVPLAVENARLAGEPAPASVPLSLAPAASRAAALGWLAAAAAVLAAGRLGRDRGVRRLFALAIVGSALLQVALGLPAWFARSKEIWGVATPLAALRLRGTYVNPNHLALLLELALAVAAAMLYRALRAGSEPAPLERRLLRAAPVALVALALFGALAFTGSRAGLLAAAAGAAAATVLAAAGRGRRRAVAALAVALAVAGLAVAGFGLDNAFGRLLATDAADSSAGARWTATARTLELARHSPWIGTGLGSFLAAFPRVQGDLPGTWRHAHDDWAELVATTGVAGTLLALAGVALAVTGVGRALARARRGEDRAAAIAAGAALSAAAVHSLFDLGLTLPANALALAVITGAALAVGDAEAAGEARRSAATRESV
jgi:O-antigen ligase